MAEREKERTGGDIGLRGGKGKEEDGEMMRQQIAMVDDGQSQNDTDMRMREIAREMKRKGVTTNNQESASKMH
uniref:Uncharacterized protein n=1 Tax=Pristionchus pacificus TaxID=54126 RepID=A0A2A6BGL1_PRIPA|eukprot:PDM65024.1 hypothetical protein PRIPAC_53280 [Pristionchus pacificus]